MKKILYQLSTHWDREWYRTFQGFRYYLVEMMDKLIDDLETGKIGKFTFDGQTIVLEDYLEIRPENKQRIEKLITQEKLKVGPWYVMPDELLVSGESIVENFLMGHKTAERFGAKTWKFGYANDIFGHIAQLPQILNGFDINSVYLGRGAEDDRRFIWKSPDGSECFTYCSNYSNLKRTIDETDDKKKYILQRLDSETSEDAPITLLNYTDDHAVSDKNMADFEKLVTGLDDCDVEYGFEKYASYVQEFRDKLPVKYGELIKTAPTIDDLRAVTDSLSSYYPLKQANDRCENNLYNTLAPMLVMAEMCGIFEKRVFFDTARKYLLKNQPHDSICGCSVDAVHQNMPYRYNQANEIEDVIKEEFITKMTAKADENADTYTLSVFNFNLTEVDEVITINVDFPKGWQSVFEGNAGFGKVNKFRIKDENGCEVAYQILDIQYNEETYKRQDITKVDRYIIAMDAKLKPFGMTCFEIVPAETLNNVPQIRHEGTLKAENDYLQLSISNSGSIDVTDKNTGKTYKNINVFVDEADAGNGWFYENIGFGSSAVVSTVCSTEVVNYGPLLKRFKITTTMKVPAQVDRYTHRRAKEVVDMDITVFVTLREHSKSVEFKTIVNNTPKDHRVRVIFPTETVGEDYVASQAFCFVNRKRGVTADGINYREPECYEKNTAGIVGVEDGANKCYFVAKEGIHQAGVYPDGTISVVLFRGIGQEFHENHAKAAQINGELEFTYAICFDNENLFSVQKNLAKNIPTSMCHGKLNAANEFVSIDNGSAEISIVKPAENGNGWIVRMFNPTASATTTSLKVNIDNAKLYETNLEEKYMEELMLNDNSAKITLEPYKIKTFIIENKC